MKIDKNKVALIAIISLTLAALTAVCFATMKWLISTSKKKTDEGCCTLEDVQPPAPTLDNPD